MVNGGIKPGEKQEIAGPMEENMMERKVYFNCDVITMNQAAAAEAVLVNDGVIAAAGAEKDVLKAAGSGAEMIDLQGCTLAPSFIDAHSHILSYAMTKSFIRLGGARSFEELAERLRQGADRARQRDGGWVIGFGYDENVLKEGRHPDRRLLDSVSGSVPVMATHASGHMGVFNTAALRAAGISGSGDGFLEETAFISACSRVPKPTAGELAANMEAAQDTYLSYGITLAQEGKAEAADLEFLKSFAESGRLKLDVAAYVNIGGAAQAREKYGGYFTGFKRGLRIGGYKIFLDGSPQARTAWMSRPYEGTENNTGFRAHSDGEVEKFIELSVSDGVQLLAHCNGDMACGQFIRCWEKAGDNKRRPVMVHAQTVDRVRQLPAMKKTGMIPSFFISHIYHWGDVHVGNLGERAETISPAGTAERLGMIYTFHTDAPVIEPDVMECVWCAVNRTTSSGTVLGVDERTGAYEALRAVTSNAAYQYFEEGSRGRIDVGKRADLVVLSKNPLKTPPERLRDIEVLATVKDGKTVYRKKR